MCVIQNKLEWIFKRSELSAILIMHQSNIVMNSSYISMATHAWVKINTSLDTFQCKPQLSAENSLQCNLTIPRHLQWLQEGLAT